MSYVLMAICLFSIVVIIYNKIKLFRQKRRKKKMQETAKAVTSVKKQTAQDYFSDIMEETMKS